MARAAVDVVRAFGGSASAADVLQFTTRWALRSALNRREIERLARGVYSLPEAPKPLRAAARLHGVISHETAAAHWLMDSLCVPQAVHVTVPRNARPEPIRGVVLHYADIADEEVTSPLRTVLDCARTLPFHEALAIADSALRRELIGADELEAAAAGLRGAGRKRILRVAEHADPRADNPFESGLRALVIEAGLLGFQPQLVIRDSVPMRVDLGDPTRQIVFEGDSYSHHGTRKAFERDCRRYDELISSNWLVLRFAWEHVMFDRDWVTQMMLATCALRSARPARRSPVPAR